MSGKKKSKKKVGRTSNYRTINNSKAISQYDLQGKLLRKFANRIEAEKISGVSRAGITNSCLGQKARAGNYIWRFSDLEKRKKIESYSELISGEKDKKVRQFDLDGNFLDEYDSLRIAHKSTRVWFREIQENCEGIAKSAGGFMWRYSHLEKRKKIEAYDDLESEETPPKIKQYDLTGALFGEYTSPKKAYKATGVRIRDIISNCEGTKKSVAGFMWRYAHLEKRRQIESYTELLTGEPERKIKQYDKNGNFLKEYDSLEIACKSVGLRGVQLKASCEGRSKSAGGFMWRYSNLEKRKKIEAYKRRDVGIKPRRVKQYDKTGKFLREYTSAREAAEVIGVKTVNIFASCQGKQKTAGGYIWKYVKK